MERDSLVAKNPYFDEDGTEPESASRPGKSALPEWAQITADMSDEGNDFDAPIIEPAPTRNPSAPARPASAPAVPVPAVPVPAAPPVLPQVPQPAAVPTSPASPQQVAPSEPRQPDRSERKPRQPRSIPEPTLHTPRPEPEVAPETTQRAGRSLGGRWKVIALRVGVWGAIGMVLLTGIFSIIGPKGPSLSMLTDSVRTAIGDNGFPLESGAQLSIRFAKEFYSLNPQEVQERDARLLTYFPGGDALSVAPLSYTSNVEQVVVAGPYLAGKPELIDKTQVVFTVALQVINPGVTDPSTKKAFPARWIYVSVPVAVDENGDLAVVGLPVVVPDPATGTGGSAYSFAKDPQAAEEAKPAVERYFELWAISDATGLEPYLQSGQSTWAARTGLNKFVQFQSLSELNIEALPTDVELPTTCTAPDFSYPCRKATATVIWSQNGGTFTQTYRMVVFNEGQYWRVLDIKGSTW